jgi:hypothetical protein
MPTLPRHQLRARNSTPERTYPIIFAVLGFVILLGVVFWACVLPKWKQKHKKPVQTRYNTGSPKTSLPTPMSKEREVSFVFPPHPAVVIPQKRHRLAANQAQGCKSTSGPVYDPQTRSPFSSKPRTGSGQPRIAMLTKSKADISRVDNEPAEYDPLPQTTLDLRPGSHKMSQRYSSVLWPANASSQKRGATRPSAKRPKFVFQIFHCVKGPHQERRPGIPHSPPPRTSNDVEGTNSRISTRRKVKPTFNDSQLDRPPQKGTLIKNKSFAKPLDGISKLPTYYEPIAFEPRSARVSYPGVSNLVPSRRLRKHVLPSRARGEACEDARLDQSRHPLQKIGDNTMQARSVHRSLSGMSGKVPLYKCPKPDCEQRRRDLSRFPQP